MVLGSSARESDDQPCCAAVTPRAEPRSGLSVHSEAHRPSVVVRLPVRAPVGHHVENPRASPGIGQQAANAHSVAVCAVPSQTTINGAHNVDTSRHVATSTRMRATGRGRTPIMVQTSSIGDPSRQPDPRNPTLGTVYGLKTQHHNTSGGTRHESGQWRRQTRGRFECRIPALIRIEDSPTRDDPTRPGVERDRSPRTEY